MLSSSPCASPVTCLVVSIDQQWWKNAYFVVTCVLDEACEAIASCLFDGKGS